MAKKQKVKLFGFRYHLVPITSLQRNLFDISLEELEREKNNIFKETILSRMKYSNKKSKVLSHRVIESNDDVIIIQLANKKSIEFDTKDWEHGEIESYPYISFALWTKKDKQYLFIEHNTNTFQYLETVQTAIEDSLNKALYKDMLRMELIPLVDEKTFWGLLEKYENRITQLSFNIVYNISSVRKTFKDSLRDLSKGTNSSKSAIVLNAPESGVLENINRENKDIEELGELTQNALSDMSIKVSGIKGKITTKDSVKEFEIAEYRGKQDGLLKSIKQIISGLK
jgi:hypothetical protein